MRFPKARPKMLRLPFCHVYSRTQKAYPFLPLKNEVGQWEDLSGQPTVDGATLPVC